MVDQLLSYFQNVTEKIQHWLEGAIAMIPNFIVALIILLLTFVAARYIRKLVYRLMKRLSRNEAFNRLTSSLSFTALVIAGVFFALGILKLDKTVTSLLAGIGIVGLALGFAFKDIASNFIAGIYMAIKSPINVGDIMEFRDTFGIVHDIGLRASTIRTFQGQDVIIPNRLVMEEKYTHYTLNRFRRIDLEVGISYGDDLEKVERVTLDAVNRIDFLNKFRKPDFYYTEFGDSAIIFTVRYWVDYHVSDYLIYMRALSQGIKNIKKAYDENGLTITFPIRTLDFGIKGGKTLADMLNAVERTP